MPSKYTVREFRENGFYHVFNRGVARQEVFLDKKDYQTFIGYLKVYLVAKKELKDLQGRILKDPPSRELKNFYGQTTLHCYCLMPNHFHLLLHQTEINGIPLFMKSLLTKYSMYFNRRYKRVGPVFQGKYRAVEVESEEQFIYLSKYIHRNPQPSGSDPVGLENYKYSSYLNYLKRFTQTWVETEDILSYFNRDKSNNSYQEFIEDYDESDIIRIKEISLDGEL